MSNKEKLFHYKDLIHFSTEILIKSGLSKERSAVVAETLVAADMMGHSTHGLQLLAPYAGELQKGDMKNSGDPVVINDSGCAVSWDGEYLPGPWLVRKGIELGLVRIRDNPVFTLTIQKSHHIGCLAVYPEMATKNGLMLILSCSDPRNKTVAPFGGLRGVYSPNPIAAGFPTENEPIIIDISMSTTANGLVMRHQKEGKKLPHLWLQDQQGNLSDDPGVIFTDPPGTVLPLGGHDSGYKGFALGIMVEALTGALCGHGRSDHPDNWGASVFMQLIDPNAFGGLSHFQTEMQNLVDESLKSTPRNPENPVRIPGHRAQSLRKRQMQNGVQIYPAVLDSLVDLSGKLSVKFPAPL